MAEEILESENTISSQVVKSSKTKKSHVCPSCLKVFKRSYDLKRHTCVQILPGKTFPCDHCDSKFVSKEKLQQHRKYVSLENQFKCGFCKLTFRGFNNFKSHVATHTDEKLFKCEMCNKSFRRKDALQYHYGSKKYLEHHRNFEQFEHLVKKTKPVVDDSIVHDCAVCNKKFKTRQALRQHAVTHENLDCDICGFTFKRSDYVEKHKRMAHYINSTNDFPCDICNEVFRSKYSVQLHKDAVHEQKLSYKCELCPRVFALQSLLDEHRTSHIREKEYSCSMCEKKFTTAHYLRCHIREHTGEKPYVCVVCNESFNGYDRLRRHIKWCKKADIIAKSKQKAESKIASVPPQAEIAGNIPESVSIPE